METKPTKPTKTTKPRSKGVSAMLVVIGCAIIAHLFFYLFCGADSNFDEKGHPVNMFGTLKQGGFVIPIVMTLLLTVFVLSIERFFALTKASGKGSITKFVALAKTKLDAGDIEGARKACDEQKGSVANILNAGLLRYEDVEKLGNLNNDEKAAIIQKELEEATTLELPYLEQNLNVIATISSLGTLFGLLGTVLGMIRSFGAMGNEGAPDSTALAIGIAEALMNTAMGIGTGAAAIVSYGYFSAKVGTISNAVDEVGFAIGQTYTKVHLGK
ncbi:MotA/TolQ/ExbB proton channel family protein [Viscerimonas tarda]